MLISAVIGIPRQRPTAWPPTLATRTTELRTDNAAAGYINFFRTLGKGEGHQGAQSATRIFY